MERNTICDHIKQGRLLHWGINFREFWDFFNVGGLTQALYKSGKRFCTSFLSKHNSFQPLKLKKASHWIFDKITDSGLQIN